MSRPRYDWWSYVKGMIRRYPQLAAEYEELHRPNVVPQGDGIGRGSGVSKPTEITALRELPRTKQREYEAVLKAIQSTKALPDGAERLRLIQLVFWQRTHTLDGAAMAVGASQRKAQEWHRLFIRLVAQNFGLLE